MKTTYLTVAALCFRFMTFGQDDSLLFKNQLKFSPLRVIDFINPGFEMSYERSFSKLSSTQLSVGYMADPFHFTPFQNTNGYRLALEEKFFKRIGRKSKTYFSAELVYYHLHFENSDARWKFNPPDSTTIVPYKDVTYYRKYTTTFNLKYGVQYNLNKHLVLDFCVGFGVRYYNVKKFHPIIPNELPVEPTGLISPFDFYNVASTPGHHFSATLPFNIKIGFAF